MAPYRPPDEWLQWLAEPPATWVEAPRYVPIGGQLHLTTLSRLTSGCLILEPDGDGGGNGDSDYDGAGDVDVDGDDAWINADEDHVHHLTLMQ